MNDMRPVFRAALASLLVGVSPAAFAARPLVTDDARILDPGGWQIESYVKDQRGARATEFWFLPAHNFGGALDRVEFTLGGNVIRSDADGNSNLVVVQAKTLLKPLETNGIGFALSVGVGRIKPGSPRDPVPEELGLAAGSEGVSTKVRYNPYFNAISSISMLDDAVVLSLNAGATRDNFEDTTLKSWAVGAEIRITDRIQGIAETYGLTRGTPAYQVGMRYWIIPSQLQMDAAFGWQHASPENLQWISIGVRILW